MLIRKPADLRHSDVTPKQFYLNRRRFLAAGSAIAGAAWALPTLPARHATMKKLNNVTKSAYTVNERDHAESSTVTSYNNYYEFGTDKEATRRTTPTPCARRPGKWWWVDWSTSPRPTIWIPS